ncbi:siderophore-iron reductase FhuF [Pseudomonas cichorii]|uniref:siderophore-iron reductase FhuF n=1 Tax=Pseudomonas cichorii TaxID=36746 RepID=UPI001C8A0986|nr:siderophore-iron reductase FhuF [Pseudomonas cichorii]MBX8516514.1 siderophore-iron reductase FhuF [Pseudomonas cichorii]
MFHPGVAAHSGTTVSALFTGPLERFGQTLLSADDPRPVMALSELLRKESLDALLTRLYGPDLMAAHLPVLVSQWAKYYFMQVIAPQVVGSLVYRWHWPLHLEQVALALDERGVPTGLKLLGEGAAYQVLPVDPFERFAGLLDDNLQPFIDALSIYGGLASSVLWCSAGDYLERCLVQLGECSEVSLEVGQALLAVRVRPDGRRNPLFQAVTHVGQRRQRRTCCLSYQVEWVGRCEHCPLPG